MNYFPYIFVAYLVAGIVLVSIRSRSHVEIDDIRKVLDKTTTAVAMPAMRVADAHLSTANLTEGSV